MDTSKQTFAYMNGVGVATWAVITAEWRVLPRLQNVMFNRRSVTITDNQTLQETIGLYNLQQKTTRDNLSL